MLLTYQHPTHDFYHSLTVKTALLSRPHPKRYPLFIPQPVLHDAFSFKQKANQNTPFFIFSSINKEASSQGSFTFHALT